MEWIIRVVDKDDKVISVEEAGDVKVLETEGGKLYLSCDDLDGGIGDDQGVIANVVDITGYRDYKGLLIKFIKDTGLTICSLGDGDLGDGDLFDENALIDLENDELFEDVLCDESDLGDESIFDNLDTVGSGFDNLDLDDDFVSRYK